MTFGLFLGLVLVTCSAQDEPGAEKCGPLPLANAVLACCDIPSAFVNASVLKECREKHKDEPECVGDCYFHATDLIVNGEADPVAWKKLATSTLAESNEWQPIITGSVDTCIERANDSMKDMSTETDPQPCNVKFGIIGRCFYHELIANCPAVSYKPSPDCDQIKDTAAKCA